MCGFKGRRWNKWRKYNKDVDKGLGSRANLNCAISDISRESLILREIKGMTMVPEEPEWGNPLIPS